MQKTKIKIDSPLGRLLGALVLLILMPIFLGIIIIVLTIGACFVLVSPILALVSPVELTFEGDKLNWLKKVFSKSGKDGARVPNIGKKVK